VSAFTLTAKQKEASQFLAGPQQHSMLVGGSRSGKTFLLVRSVIVRALKAANSRHVIFRYRFNAIKASIVLDTFPKVMSLAFPGISYNLNKTDFYVTFPNGSEVWFAGLDDKERAEKVLGMEFVTIYYNECSQIPYSSVEMSLSRLAQKCEQVINGQTIELKPRVFYDLNPTTKSHWTYKLFINKIDPITNKPLKNKDNYKAFRINPADNIDNLGTTYLQTLSEMSEQSRIRFLLGEYIDDNPNALFRQDIIERNRVTDVNREYTRVVVAVDPSGADDSSPGADAIGIIVAGIGVDGKAYIIEDATVTAGPATWGRIAASLYDKHQADCIVAEKNYGGAMVKHVIQTARPNTPYNGVTATRGKHVRAEPFSSLYEQGRVRHVGYFPELEEELCAFSSGGYVGDKSPNRADAAIWALTDLFGAIINPRKKPPAPIYMPPGDSVIGY
jgi:PBSX family phage terminase large subunit